MTRQARDDRRHDITAVTQATDPAGGPSPHARDPDAIAEVARRRAINPKSDPLAVLPDVHPSRLPRHVAFIMDGNGRWAESRGLPRSAGHRGGAGAVRAVVEGCGMLGIECVTLYSFSMENWRRPREEVDALMELCVLYCEGERDALAAENIRFRAIGRRGGLPRDVARAIDSVERATAACTGPVLCLAMNYGSRAEIVDAARSLAADAAAGRLDPAAIDEAMFESRLYTRGLRDPDLLVRTAGERRISNYLLWQLSYAEIHVTPTLWPDFGTQDLHAAVRDYAGRVRRFGAVPGAAGGGG